MLSGRAACFLMVEEEFLAAQDAPNTCPRLRYGGRGFAGELMLKVLSRSCGVGKSGEGAEVGVFDDLRGRGVAWP